MAAMFPRPFSIHVVVTAARAPSASHAMAPGATLPPPPQRAQRPGQGNGAGAVGRTRQRAAVSPCPPRALQDSHTRSFTANHGQSKPLLNGCVLGVSCSSQALDAGSIPVVREASASRYSTAPCCSATGRASEAMVHVCLRRVTPRFG
jgi:hypothetical protein